MRLALSSRSSRSCAPLSAALEEPALSDGPAAVSSGTAYCALNVFLQNLQELGDDVSPFSVTKFPVHVHGSFGILECARQRDADVGVLRFTRAVHHASHDCNLQIRHARIRLPPHRHLVAQIRLNVFRHVLEERRRRPSAARDMP